MQEEESVPNFTKECWEVQMHSVVDLVKPATVIPQMDQDERQAIFQQVAKVVQRALLQVKTIKWMCQDLLL